MSVKIYTMPSIKGYDLMYALDEKDIPYEVEAPTMGRSARNKIKEGVIRDGNIVYDRLSEM